MRNAFSLLALSATLAAQEPPVLVTTPPQQDPAFGAAALGGGVTEVAQLTMLCKPGSNPPTWYVTATVHRSGPTALWTGWVGNAVATAPGVYTITDNSATELANLPVPLTDYFAFNASFDRQCMVFDSGASSQPAVYVRPNNNKGTPWLLFGSVPSPVAAGYRDSQIGDTITAMTVSGGNYSGAYEFVYIDGLDLKKVPMTLSGPAGGSGTVTLGTPITIAQSAIQKHSPSGLRQGPSGLPTDIGVVRALIFSKNNSSADSFFRSTTDDFALSSAPTIAPEMQIYDDANWKANPGHIGGSLYWAYATTIYGNPMKQDVVALASVQLPLAGGADTIIAWAPPSAQPQLGVVFLGLLQSPGINLSPLITRGLLGLNPALLVLLFSGTFDPFWGEMGLPLVFPGQPGPRAISMQVVMLNIVTSQIFLGNNAAIYWR
jgi:hypothetical protein